MKENNNFSLSEYTIIHYYDIYKYKIPRCVWKMFGRCLFSVFELDEARYRYYHTPAQYEKRTEELLRWVVKESREGYAWGYCPKCGYQTNTQTDYCPHCEQRLLPPEQS